MLPTRLFPHALWRNATGSGRESLFGCFWNHTTGVKWIAFCQDGGRSLLQTELELRWLLSVGQETCKLKETESGLEKELEICSHSPYWPGTLYLLEKCLYLLYTITSCGNRKKISLIKFYSLYNISYCNILLTISFVGSSYDSVPHLNPI